MERAFQHAIELNPNLVKFDETGPAIEFLLARIHTALGEKDHALKWLKAAYASRDRNMPWICENKPSLAKERDSSWGGLI